MGLGDAGRGADWVTKLDTLGFLMVLQGTGEALFLACVLYLVRGIQPPDMVAVSVLIVLGIGLAALLVFAGFMVLERRRRRLALIILGLNISMILTAWCAPSAAALALYGLLVLTRDEVLAAFSASAAVEQRDAADKVRGRTAGAALAADLGVGRTWAGKKVEKHDGRCKPSGPTTGGDLCGVRW